MKRGFLCSIWTSKWMDYKIRQQEALKKFFSTENQLTIKGFEKTLTKTRILKYFNLRCLTISNRILCILVAGMIGRVFVFLKAGASEDYSEPFCTEIKLLFDKTNAI